MKSRDIWALGFLGAVLVGGCGTDTKPAEPVYSRLGEAKGVQAVVADFLARVNADEKINGYFLNASLDATRLAGCLEKQIGSLTGGPEKYDCKSMKDAHKDLHISKLDFDDFRGHLSDALVAAKVAKADIDTVLGVLDPMSADIVTDATSDGTIYQRVGRKPAIDSVVLDFHARVAADIRINSFFATTNVKRLATCLERQVCFATGGPCKYGDEIPDADAGIKTVCRDMKETHAGLNIGYSDFQNLGEDMVAALDAASVPTADKNAILSVIGPMCTDIVTDMTKGTCPAPAP